MNRPAHIGPHGLLVLAILLWSAVGPVSAQDLIWSANYGGVYNEGGQAGLRTTENGCLVLGSTYSFGAGDHDLYLLCLDSLGDTLWSTTYGGSASDYGYDIDNAGDGGFFVVGTTRSYGSGKTDIYLLKINFAGGLEWSRIYGGPEYEGGYSVRATSDGGCIVAGSTSSIGLGSDDIYLLKTDAVGDTLWTRTYGGAAEEQAFAVRTVPGGGYIVTGYTGSYGVGYYSVYAVRTDNNGDTLWTATYGGDQADIGNSVETTLDGGFVFVGATASGGYSDVYLVKTDPDGQIEWEQTFGGGLDDRGYSVRAAADGGYFVAGTTESFGNGQIDILVVKTDPIGFTEWQRTFGGTESDYCRSAVADDGAYFLIGRSYSYSAGGSDIYLLRIKADGATDVEEIPGDLLPQAFVLEQNYPNPFNLRTNIEFELPQRADATLTIYNILGQVVRRWPFGSTSAGRHIVNWNGLDSHDREIASGVYLYSLRYGALQQTRKMVLLK